MSDSGGRSEHSQAHPQAGWVIPRIVLIAGVLILLSALVYLLVGGHGQVHLLASAFGQSYPTSAKGTPATAGQASSIFTDATNLSHNAQYLLLPASTLAAGTGASMWALGHRRGPGVVGGAVAAGTLGLLAPTFIK